MPPSPLGGRKLAVATAAEKDFGTNCLRTFRVSCGDTIADGHTTSNAPDLFRPPELSGVGPGQF